MTTDLTNHRLDHYHLLERLGGNMGDVYRAWDTSLEREVAVKVLAADLVRSADGPLRFRREAQRAAQVGAHPNVVSTFGAGEAGGWPYIAMELLRGEDLGQLIDREGALPPERALRLLEQAAAAIDHLHAQNPPIIHRDIKPANFMVLAGDRLILTDFGLARRLDDSRVTKSGTVIGSPCYMAPEQAMGAAGGAPVGKAADIYSLGAMAYEMLCGRPPFVSDHLGAVLAAHQSAPVPPVGQWRGELPGGVDKVFGRAMAKRPDGRHDSAGTLVADIARVLALSTGKVAIRPGRKSAESVPSKIGATTPHQPPQRRQSGTATLSGQSLAMRLGLIAVVSLAVVGLVLVTTLGVDRELRQAEQGASSARAEAAAANATLLAAASAGDLEAQAAAKATVAAADIKVAASDATLAALRATATFERQPTPRPGQTADATRAPQSKAIVISLVSPPDGQEIKSCSVRLVWRLEEAPNAAGQAPVQVGICRKLRDGAPECETVSANPDRSTTDYRPGRDGTYEWRVIVDSGAMNSEERTFVWRDGGCAEPSAKDDGDGDPNVGNGGRSEGGGAVRPVEATPGRVLPRLPTVTPGR